MRAPLRCDNQVSNPAAAIEDAGAIHKSAPLSNIGYAALSADVLAPTTGAADTAQEGGGQRLWDVFLLSHNKHAY